MIPMQRIWTVAIHWPKMPGSPDEIVTYVSYTWQGAMNLATSVTSRMHKDSRLKLVQKPIVRLLWDDVEVRRTWAKKIRERHENNERASA